MILNIVFNGISMGRRKDHSPEKLKSLIRDTAEKIISSKGLDKLTARSLASSIGYTPGTIYNFYRDMDELILDINYLTLGKLLNFCRDRTKDLSPDFMKVKALAYAYIEFANNNTRAWETLFSRDTSKKKKLRLPKHYQERLIEVFDYLEVTLKDSIKISNKEAAQSARILWACLHGISVLNLDGQLSIIGIEDPYKIIDELLYKYFAGSHKQKND